jgi:hypothetical protein
MLVITMPIFRRSLLALATAATLALPAAAAPLASAGLLWTQTHTGVAGGFLDLAGGLLHGAFDLVRSAIGAQLLVAGDFADRVLHVATSFLGSAFDFIFVHLGSPCCVVAGKCEQPRNVPAGLQI